MQNIGTLERDPPVYIDKNYEFRLLVSDFDESDDDGDESDDDDLFVQIGGHPFYKGYWTCYWLNDDEVSTMFKAQNKYYMHESRVLHFHTSWCS